MQSDKNYNYFPVDERHKVPCCVGKTSKNPNMSISLLVVNACSFPAINIEALTEKCPFEVHRTRVVDEPISLG